MRDSFLTMSQRFLISRLSALGDVVCSLPVAVALKTTFPDCHITWVVDQRFHHVVKCCRCVDEVVKLNRRGASPEVEVIRGKFYDVAFDVQGLLKSASVLAKVKADRKLGYHWQREGAGLFSQRVLPDPSSLHVVDQYVDVARAAGAEMERAEFGLQPLPEDLDKVRHTLSLVGEGPLVLMNAGAGWASKRWPPGSFAALNAALRKAGLKTAFIGSGSADQAVFREIADLSSEEPVSFIGQTSIGELIALISLAEVHVGGDTGSSHIAAALGIPAVGLYSRTRPERSCPYGQIDRCHYDPESIADISPESVMETVMGAVR